ncbi:MAG: hypothetical protein WCE21_02730 [Candidatus Babeliales bacterium]
MIHIIKKNAVWLLFASLLFVKVPLTGTADAQYSSGDKRLVVCVALRSNSAHNQKSIEYEEEDAQDQYDSSLTDNLDEGDDELMEQELANEEESSSVTRYLQGLGLRVFFAYLDARQYVIESWRSLVGSDE